MRSSPKPYQSKTVLDQLSRSILPVVSEHNEVEYGRYTIGGTTFLVRYKSLLCSLTAKHVINNCHSDTNRIRIRTVYDGTSFLPLKNVTLLTGDSTNRDIAIIEVNQKLMDQRLNNEVCPILLDNFSPTNHFTKEHSLFWSRGYPKDLSSVEHDEEQMRFQGVILEASYECPRKEEHCHTIRFDDLSNVDSINGLSGSPIFHFTKSGSRNVMYYNFAGMLIQGSKESKLGHFIDSKAIYAALDELLIMSCLAKTNQEK
jgi:hypothetical protein